MRVLSVWLRRLVTSGMASPPFIGQGSGQVKGQGSQDSDPPEGDYQAAQGQARTGAYRHYTQYLYIL